MFIKLNWTITWGIYSLIFLNKINLLAILCNMLKDAYPFSDRPEMWTQVPYSFSCVTVLLNKNDNRLNTDSLFSFILYVRCRSFTPGVLWEKTSQMGPSEGKPSSQIESHYLANPKFKHFAQFLVPPHSFCPLPFIPLCSYLPAN